MSKPVRTFAVFRDAQPEFEVDRGTAREVVQRAFDLVGKYAGPIIIGSLNAAKFPPDMLSLDPNKIRLGDNQHSLLVTQRYAADGPLLGGVASAEGPGPYGVSSWSKTILKLHPPNPVLNREHLATVTEASRAIAYGLGASSCENAFECIVSNPVAALSGKEFCGLCAARLAVGGQIAAAQA
jgi:hypothetical protein